MTQDRARDAALVRLERFDAAWTDDDPYANLKADVVAYGHLDPLGALTGLAATSGIPVGALARYVLARWASGGNEALLELGTSGVDHLARVVAAAEATGTDAARLEAYAVVRELVAWLRAGLEADDRPGVGDDRGGASDDRRGASDDRPDVTDDRPG